MSLQFVPLSCGVPEGIMLSSSSGQHLKPSERLPRWEDRVQLTRACRKTDVRQSLEGQVNY